MERRKDISLEKFLCYSKVLGSQSRDARTTQEILDRWARRFGEPPSLRSVQGDMEFLSSSQGRRAPLVRRVEERVLERGKPAKRQPKYYLARSQVASRFLTEDAATELMLARQVYRRVLDLTRSETELDLIEAAEQTLASSPTATRLREGIRMLPHGGIGRLPATFDPGTRNAATEALCHERQLQFDYKVDHRNPEGRVERRRISPLGLVCKDGQVYVVGVQGLTDPPKPYALHRMSDVMCLPEPAVRRPRFDLDEYIARTHQFSHPEEFDSEPVQLKLRVQRMAIYHFRERPLTADQVITVERGGEWHTVAATVPITTQLFPFLVSMGPWIEVLGPAQVRSRIAEWVGGMWALQGRSARTLTVSGAVDQQTVRCGTHAGHPCHCNGPWVERFLPNQLNALR